MEKLFNVFDFDGDLIAMKPYGNGHINDTYKVVTTKSQYIIQRINHYVFKRPNELMANYRLVTSYLKERIARRGGDVLRETVTIVPTKDGKDFYRTVDGQYYRAILFIADTFCLETMSGPEDFYQTGLAFGKFQADLRDFDANQLYESIPDFHHTPKRLEAFKAVLKTCDKARMLTCQDEIDFILAYEKLAGALYQAHLPLRVTHNDTKLNNILFDRVTKKPLCVIDLDTIMPGFVANDFGDAIRSGATYSAEDEKDVDKVTLDLALYESFLKGFVAGSDGFLTKDEIASLPIGALVITYEQAIRFLTDYLEGDVYYTISYPDHNLVRTRTQIKLVKEMEKYQAQIVAMLVNLG